MQILAVNVLAVNRPLPLHTMSKSVICTQNSAKSVLLTLHSALYTLSVLSRCTAWTRCSRPMGSLTRPLGPPHAPQ